MGLINKLPINDRPREKARIYGIESLSNAELIALLLCTGNKKDDALQLAQKIILNVGSLSNLCHYTIEQLKEFDGIKEVKAIRIKAALELHQRIEKETHQLSRSIKTMLLREYENRIEEINKTLKTQRNEIERKLFSFISVK